jgi:hypothetical protein
MPEWPQSPPKKIFSCARPYSTPCRYIAYLPAVREAALAIRATPNINIHTNDWVAKTGSAKSIGFAERNNMMATVER